jgi:hypothetical protein
VPHVYEVVWEKMRNQFGLHELAIVTTDASNQPRWKNETRQARRNLVLVNDGRMERKRDHVTWEISVVSRPANHRGDRQGAPAVGADRRGTHTAN